MKHHTTLEALQLQFEGQLAFADMARRGIRVDKKYLDTAIDDMEKKIVETQASMENHKVAKEWKKVYGDRTNFGSREQLAKLLFQHMGFKSQGITATGRQRTDKTALDKVDDPFVLDFLKVEGLKKDKSTYLEGIRKELVERDGMWFVHPSFHLNTAQTFRPSGSDPNWLNCPVRDPEKSKVIRRCFIPRPKRHFGEPDLSQIEVRIAACYNHDPVLIQYIKDKTTDMHRDTACEIYGLNPDQVSKETRHSAKNQFVFPQFYGSVFFQCAPPLWDSITRRKLTTTKGTPLGQWVKKKLGITQLGLCNTDQKVFPAVPGTFEHHIKTVEEKFWKRFAVYTKWKRDWYDAFVECGSCQSLVGFAWHGQHSRNDILNYPIQCDAFMCMLWTIVQLNKWLRKHKMKTIILGMIYDSIQLDCPPNELHDVLNKYVELTSEGLPRHWDWIVVPIESEVDVSPVGKSWYYKEEWQPDTERAWWPVSYMKAHAARECET